MLSAIDLYRRLIAHSGTPRWWSDDPFIVMFQSVLVQNTAWSGVTKTCAAMGEALSLAAVAAMPAQELEAHIRPCGFARRKAATIRALLDWYGQYQCDPARVAEISAPVLRRELLARPGVGAETADVILVYAFYRPRFIVDAYTRRLLARLGGDFADDEAIRRYAAATLPEDARVYGWFHWLILEHGIAHCKKVPQCQGCCLKCHCAYE